MDPLTGAIIAGGAILGGLSGSRSSSSGRESNQVSPYPRDASATMLWDTYMNRLLGDQAYPLMNFRYPYPGSNGTSSYNMQVSLPSILDALANRRQAGTLGNLGRNSPSIIQALGLEDTSSNNRDQGELRYSAYHRRSGGK